jgi:hypothetical protein
MKLTALERKLLVGAYRDVARLVALDRCASIRRDYIGAYRLRIRDAQQGFVPVDAAIWIGHTPTVAERRAVSRAYAELEAKGLAMRCNLYGAGRRVTHLKLTGEGEAQAKVLA